MAGANAHYVTSLDRAGLAIGAGGALTGVLTVVLVALGGRTAPFDLIVAWLIGAFFAAIGIVAVAGPVWLALHLSNRRSPGIAAFTGAMIAVALFTVIQTWGLGSFAASDTASVGYRLISAVATSVMIAVAAAGIGWVMHRVAYRRIF